MVPNTTDGNGGQNQTEQNVAYIRQMLGELRQVARREGADMLTYLIEMAYVEAGDLQSGRRTLSAGRHERDPAARMSL